MSEIHRARPWLSEAEQAALRQAVREFIGEKARTATQEAERHQRRLRELTAQQQKLVQLYYRDAISVEVLKVEQERIKSEEEQDERWRHQAVAQLEMPPKLLTMP
ncbi:MAG: hypothetical protein ACLQMH_16120 [Solirubrobacteraceae bacterium]